MEFFVMETIYGNGWSFSMNEGRIRNEYKRQRHKYYVNTKRKRRLHRQLKEIIIARFKNI